jgi:hypothetical protein
MAVKSNALEPVTARPESETDTDDNGVEKLLPLLDPIVINAPPDKNAWKKLDYETVFWLVNTAAEAPWLNHLSLAGVIYADGESAHPVMPLKQTLSFLRWAIPDHYSDLSSLKMEEALAAYYGDPPQIRGFRATTAIGSLQLYMTRYLETLPPEKREALSPFLLPKLVRTRRLAKLRTIAEGKTQSNRKEQAFAVVRELPALVAMGRQRYKWLANLDNQVQQAVELIKRESATLPVVIKVKSLDGQQEMVFRVWDKKSWVEAHEASFSKTTVYLVKQQTEIATQVLFLQLVGDIPDSSWFLRAIDLGILQGARISPEGRRYMQEWQIPLLGQMQAGLLRPNASGGQSLSAVRRTAAGTPEDSRIVFCVEPLLAGAAVGLFVLISLVQTGMRIGELMQVTLDKNCVESGVFPQFDDATGTWKGGPKQVYWRLYPKGSEKRERYLVTPQMLEAMLIMLDLHKRFYGPDSIKSVPARKGSQFSHSRRYAGKHKFVLQWGGHHLPIHSIQKCLVFLLLEHPCRDQDGNPTRITPHILRHGVAGWLRNQGVPLEDIMALLKQVNIAVTDYYSKLSPPDLYKKIGPALTTLTELAGIDPTTIRNAWDIQNLMQEALKRYGALRHTPGGTCSVFTPCEVQFKCASCPHYMPDPSRRDEVKGKIASCSKAIRLFTEMGDYLQVDNQKSHLCEWERVEKEMDALAAVELVSPPAESVLKDLGIDDLGEELLLSLKPSPKQLPGGNKTHA